MAGLEPAAMGGSHLALPSSELHDHINCFRAGETHAQLRSECGSYIVRARSLTKLATSAPDQECDYLANPITNFIDNIILVRIHVDLSPLDYNLVYGGFRPNSIIKSICTLVVPAWIEQAHTELQSAALPTELQNHINGRYCYAPAKALTIYQPCGKTTGLMQSIHKPLPMDFINLWPVFVTV